jgi:hypothetical protein
MSGCVLLRSGLLLLLWQVERCADSSDASIATLVFDPTKLLNASESNAIVSADEPTCGLRYAHYRQWNAAQQDDEQALNATCVNC